MGSMINCNGYYDLHFESIIVVNGLDVIDFDSPSDTPVCIAVNTDGLQVYSKIVKYTPGTGPIQIPNPCGGDPITVDYIDLNALCISGSIHYVVGVPVLKTSSNVLFDPENDPVITLLPYATSGGDASLVGQTVQMVDFVPPVLPSPVVTVLDTHVVSVDKVENGYGYRVFGTFRITLETIV